LSMCCDGVGIVRVGHDQYAELLRLLNWRRSGQEDSHLSYADERAMEQNAEHDIMHSDTFFVFAADAGARFVGYTAVALIPKPDPRLGTVYVDELWVAPPYRRRGIASMLVRQVLALGREKGLWRVRLHVSRRNRAALKLYQRLGFCATDHSVFCEREI